MTRFGTTAPKSAPNVLLVLIDDMGFGACSAFGGHGYSTAAFGKWHQCPGVGTGPVRVELGDGSRPGSMDVGRAGNPVNTVGRGRLYPIAGRSCR